MIFRKPFIFSALLLFTGLWACDIIEGPKVDYSNVNPNGAGKKVLIEDFTGHYCGSCPLSHEKEEELDSLYEGNVIFVNLHGGSLYFSLPHGGIYQADYRTAMAMDLDGEFGVEANFGYPKAFVNRREFNGSIITSYTTWTTLISPILAEEPILDLNLVSDYDEVSGTASIEVSAEYFTEGNVNHNVVVLIKEDSIISAQKDYRLTLPQNDTFYVHMDMHRGNATEGSWGELLVNGGVRVADPVLKTFSLTLDPSWDPDHCEIVAYVIDNVSREIIQAEEVDLK